MIVCEVPSCILFSHVAPYLGNCIVQHYRQLLLPSWSSSLWCQVEASAEGARAGLCEKLLFDVPYVASSHEVEGKLCTTAMA